MTCAYTPSHWPTWRWCGERDVPCRNVGGETGAVLRIQELGGASDVLPLGRGGAACRGGGEATRIIPALKKRLRRQKLPSVQMFPEISHSRTYDGAKQTQTGGVALPRVPRALPPGGGQRDTQSDGSVKLAPPRLNGDHGAKICLVTQQLCNQLIWNWLSLRFQTTDEMGSASTGRCMDVADIWD